MDQTNVPSDGNTSSSQSTPGRPVDPFPLAAELVVQNIRDLLFYQHLSVRELRVLVASLRSDVKKLQELFFVEPTPVQPQNSEQNN